MPPLKRNPKPPAPPPDLPRLTPQVSRAGRNEPAVPSAAVRLGRLASGASARWRFQPGDLASPTTARPLNVRHRVGGGDGWPHTRRGIHKAVHTQGGAHTRQSVATAGVLLFTGGAGAGPRSERSEASVERSEPQQRVRLCPHKAVHTQGGARTRRCTHKAVCGHCRSHVI